MPERLRILHLISTLDTGGAEQNLCRLVSGMDRGSFENMVVSMTGNGPVGEKIAAAGVPVAKLSMPKGMPDPRGILNLKKNIRAFRPDIIQSWMYHADLLGCFFTGSIPLIWNIRCADMDLSQYGHIYRLSVKLGATCSRIPLAVIANSHAGKSYHETLGYHPRQWEIIPNGFDTSFFKPNPALRKEIRQELHIPENALVFGLIARLDPMKDHATFFAAARLLLKSHPDTHFILAGRGIDRTNPYVQSLLNDMPACDQFHLLGERQDIPRILSGMDIVCSSSISEGLPNTIGEAMAAGIPCVVTDVGDSRLLIDDTGVVVPSRDPRTFASALISLITAGPEHRADLGRKARARVQEHYSLASTIKKYEELYRKVLSRHRKTESS